MIVPRAVMQYMKEFGFTDSESTVLFHLVSNNMQTLRQLQRSLGKSTGILSVALKKLTVRKIVQKTLVNDSPTYFIEEGSKIIQNIQSISNQLTEKTQRRAKLLTQFIDTLTIESEHPKVIFYSDVVGMNKAYQHALAHADKEIIGYFSAMELSGLEDKKHHFIDFIRERVKKGISVRNIALKSRHSLEMKLRDKKELRELRLVETNTFPPDNTEIMIYENFVNLISIKNGSPLAFIIEDENIVGLLRMIFELAWKSAESEDKKIMEQMKKFKNADKMFKTK